MIDITEIIKINEANKLSLSEQDSEEAANELDEAIKMLDKYYKGE